MGSSSKRHDKIDFKKHVKTTAVYFSLQDKVDLKKHVKTTTAVYFSVQDKVHLRVPYTQYGFLSVFACL